jgi:pimeloyl-ACP methyl ester carboxylesterase
MRFFVLAVAIATLTSAAGVPRSAKPVVVLVHGRGHVDADSAALRREWKRDLDAALQTVGLPRLADEDVRLAWYADVVDAPVDSACVTDEDSLGIEGFARSMIGALASAIPTKETPEIRALFGDVLYAIDGSIRCTSERRVGDAIDAALRERRPVIVVAYSLGSIVAYRHLASRPQRAKDLKDVRLVTLGSPLGNRDVRELLGVGDSLTLPTTVSSWENVYDSADIFAAPLEEGSLARGVRDVLVESEGSDDRHHIGHYLRDRATGAAVGRALCATATPEMAQACRRLNAPRTT